MSKKMVALLLALVMVLSFTTVQAEETVALTVTDMTGREVTFTEPVTRVVALSASDCEILYALGAGDMLVGRGAYCNYPAEVEAVPSVQSGYETNIEEILALEPQVLIMTTMAQTDEQVKQLEENGVQVICTENNDIAGAYEAIRLLGAVVGKNEEAEALVTSMQDAFAAITASVENTGKTVYFEVSPLQWGLYTAGRGTFMDEIATMCGLTNAFADVDGWAAISEEQVLERNPDYIVSVSGVAGAFDEISSRDGWSNVTAVVNGGVFEADADSFSRPGPRLVDAAQSLYNFVYQAVEDVVPAA